MFARTAPATISAEYVPRECVPCGMSCPALRRVLRFPCCLRASSSPCWRIIAGAEPLSLHAPRYVVDPAPPPEAPPPAPTRVAAAPAMGGGFIEFIFGGGGDAAPPYDTRGAYAARGAVAEEYARPPIDPKYLRQIVDYSG